MRATDYKDIRGQYHVKRGLEIVCAGNHSVLLIGPKKSGKTTLLSLLSTLTDYPIIHRDMLPCPCGNFTDPKKECVCTPHKIQRHIYKYNEMGSLDIHLEVPKMTPEQIQAKREGEASAVIKARIDQAKINHRPGPEDMDREANDLLKMAILEIGLSSRAYDKIIDVARTIAQMDAKEVIEACHISESIGYRCLDRNLWA